MTPSFDPFMPNPMTRTPDTLRAAFRPHDWDEGSKYAVAWLRDNVGIPSADAWEEQIARLQAEITLLVEAESEENARIRTRLEAAEERASVASHDFAEVSKRLETAENAMRDVLADHDERMALYRDMESQPHRMRVMRRLRVALAGEWK